MKLSIKTKKLLSAVVILIWMPLYVFLAIPILSNLPRLPILIEVAIYILAGIIWVLPFRFVFLGVGKAAPEDENAQFLDDGLIAADKARARQFDPNNPKG